MNYCKQGRALYLISTKTEQEEWTLKTIVIMTIIMLFIFIIATTAGFTNFNITTTIISIIVIGFVINIITITALVFAIFIFTVKLKVRIDLPFIVGRISNCKDKDYLMKIVAF